MISNSAKICKMTTIYGDIEGILLDITDSGPEKLLHVVHISFEYVSKSDRKLRFGFFNTSIEDVSKIEVLNKGYKPYFDLLFEGNIDYNSFENLREEWK